MNIPNSDKKHEIPDEAQGNPVYEQTRQDMPLWCCGRNCGRNTRIVCAILALVGIGCSLWACMSVKYFSFVALRNDTFFDEDKAFPAPFEYATEANVGLFKYEILEVFQYPWPPERRERDLADKMLIDELRRLQEVASEAPDTTNSTEPTNAPSSGPTISTPSPTESPTKAPTPRPTVNLDDCDGVDSVEPGPGSVACGVTPSPTETPTIAPTAENINDVIAREVPLNTVMSYEDGIGQFDSTFTNAQRGAIFGPVFAFLGTMFSMMELCFCTFKCSWLPGALFIYLAFMFQLFTLFLFLSEDWCKYDQDCALGNAGFGSVIAVICYMIAQSLLCCSPRPTPYFNLCKNKTPKRKKKKHPRNTGEEDGLRGDPDSDFQDEPGGYVDPYDEDDNDYAGESYYGDSYADDDGYGNESSVQDSEPYSSAYNDESYDDDGQDSYYTEDDSQYTGYDDKRY